MNDKFLFLQSTRFWAMIIASVSMYLQTKGWIGEPEMMLIGTIAVFFTGIRTIDRFAERIG